MTARDLGDIWDYYQQTKKLIVAFRDEVDELMDRSGAALTNNSMPNIDGSLLGLKPREARTKLDEFIVELNDEVCLAMITRIEQMDFADLVARAADGTQKDRANNYIRNWYTNLKDEKKRLLTLHEVLAAWLKALETARMKKTQTNDFDNRVRNFRNWLAHGKRWDWTAQGESPETVYREILPNLRSELPGREFLRVVP